MKISINCIICKKTFKVYPYRLKRINGVVKCCSKECYYKSKIGINVSKETKIKMSKSHGKPTWLNGQIPWNRGKKGLQKAWNKNKICNWRGKNHWNWQGGKTVISKKIKNSIEYREWRKSVLKRDNYTCLECSSNYNLEVHHIKEFCKYKKLRFDVDNGKTLCSKCHRETDNYGGRVLCQNA